MSSTINETRPVEPWEVPVQTRQKATKAIGLVCELIGLTGVHVRYYESDQPNGGPEDAGNPPGVWLRVTKNPAELAYEAAYQCRRFWNARHTVLLGRQAEEEAAAWAAGFMRRLMAGQIG